MKKKKRSTLPQCYLVSGLSVSSSLSGAGLSGVSCLSMVKSLKQGDENETKIIKRRKGAGSGGEKMA